MIDEMKIVTGYQDSAVMDIITEKENWRQFYIEQLSN